MIRFTYLMLFFSVAATASSQVLLDALPVPAVGDSVTRFVVLNPEIDPGEAGQDLDITWEFPDTLGYTEVYVDNDAPALFPNANRTLVVGAVKQYLEMTTTYWDQVGFTGEDPVGFEVTVSSIFTAGFSQLYAPLSFGDTVAQNATSFTGIPLAVIPDSILNELPLVPDSVRVVIHFDRRDIVDASGSLTINGQTFSVARQMRYEIRNARVEAKVSILPWTDVTDLILEYISFDVPLNDTVSIYRYFAEDVGYPLAAVFMDTDTSVQRVEYSFEVVSAVRELAGKARDLVVFPNPAQEEVYISADINPQPARMVLMDILGRVLQVQKSGTREILRLDLAGVSPGMYVVSVLSADGKIMGSAVVLKESN